nr:DNA polymerase III subunit delta [Gammaproteobacteria bacterium]
MRIKAEQLRFQLNKGLAPVYVVSGDEPLLAMEAADAIRDRARAQGYTGREVLNVEPGFDWAQLTGIAGTMSLFSEKRIIEVRLPGGRPGDAGAKALAAYAGQPPEDTLLLLLTGRLDAQAQRSRWYQALDAAGVAVQVWPLDRQRLPAWLTARMRERELQPDAEAVAMLSDRVEGNLLAAAQEVEKLYLLHGTGAICAADVAQAVTDSTRYDVYRLVDSAVGGEAARSARILRGLQQECVEVVLVLWALARELRALERMAAECSAENGVVSGRAMDVVMSRHKVWQRRKPLVRLALQRHSVHQWRRLLRAAAGIDRSIKGAATGNPWDEL